MFIKLNMILFEIWVNILSVTYNPNPVRVTNARCRKENTT